MSGHALSDPQLRAMHARPIATLHPRSLLSFAILAHEVGHHALGNIRPRCLSEYRAWQFAFEQLDRTSVTLIDPRGDLSGRPSTLMLISLKGLRSAY